jgi:hypothetical protein
VGPIELHAVIKLQVDPCSQQAHLVSKASYMSVVCGVVQVTIEVKQSVTQSTVVQVLWPACPKKVWLSACLANVGSSMQILGVDNTDETESQLNQFRSRTRLVLKKLNRLFFIKIDFM